MLIWQFIFISVVIVSTHGGADIEKENGTAIKTTVHDEVSKDINITKPNELDNKTVLVHRGREGVTPIFMEGQSNPVNVVTKEPKPILVNNSSNILIPPVPSLQPTESIANSSIHARKGVSQEIAPETVLESNKDKLKIDITNSATNNTKSDKKITNISFEITSSNTVAMNTTASSTTPSTTTTTTKKPIPKKPLITLSSAEAFPQTDFQSTPNKEVVESSTSAPVDPVVQANPQVQSNEDSSSRGPSYIIPIVIPIFALPLLGLIGYKAIRHGKEAWRNRHYRRMDFLIDGMYND